MGTSTVVEVLLAWSLGHFDVANVHPTSRVIHNCREFDILKWNHVGKSLDL